MAPLRGLGRAVGDPCKEQRRLAHSKNLRYKLAFLDCGSLLPLWSFGSVGRGKRQRTGALQKLRHPFAFWTEAVLCRLGVGNIGGKALIKIMLAFATHERIIRPKTHSECGRFGQ